MPKPLVDVAKLESLITPICAAQGVDLVDARVVVDESGPVLRVLLELPAQHTLPQGVGVSLEDCTRVSRAVSELLDADEDLIPGHYRLEVGSPGVERPLIKPHDFENYAGREVHIATKRPLGSRKNFSGTLGGCRGGEVLLRDAAGEEIALPLDEIAKAHLVFRF
jgi:ribosome maturation factor RimP